MARKTNFDKATVFKAKREIIEYTRDNGMVWDYSDFSGNALTSHAMKLLIKEGVLIKVKEDAKKGITFYQLKS